MEHTVQQQANNNYTYTKLAHSLYIINCVVKQKAKTLQFKYWLTALSVQNLG